MDDDDVVAHFVAAAAERGPIPRGIVRVVVIESSLALTVKDFDDRTAAIAYADDAASESDDNPPIAKVFDEHLHLVHEGRHYSSRH